MDGFTSILSLYTCCIVDPFCRLKPMGLRSGGIGFRFASSQNIDMISFIERFKSLSLFLFFVLKAYNECTALLVWARGD
jgi:hypothetical protein